MGFHTFDPARADQLEDPTRYAYLSVDELLALFDPGPEDVVADLGSGTGFYTDDVAAAAGTVYAVDVQPEMHELYREKGMPENVEPLTAPIDDLPLDDGALDAAFSTMTYHEFAGEGALDELARVLGPGGRLVTVDWSASGEGESGPPRDERFDTAAAVSHHEAAGFTVERADERPETMLVVATQD